jgi:hypothetical protein
MPVRRKRRNVSIVGWIMVIAFPDYA